MSLRNVAALLLTIGGIALGAALVWWGLTFHSLFDTLGLGRCLTCLYSNGLICQAAATASGFWEGLPVYPPALLWGAVAALVAGLILRAAAPKPDAGR